MGEEPWTTVGPRKRRTRRRSTALAVAIPAPASALPTPSTSAPAPSPSEIERLLATLSAQRTSFRRSAFGRALCASAAAELSRRRATVRSAVCVGLGSAGRAEPALRARSLAQLAGFLEVAGALGVAREALVVQDPAFTAVDGALFAALGVRVVQDPQARECVGAAGFLFAPFLEGAVLLRCVLPGVDPLLYVGCEDLADMKYQPFVGSDVELMRQVAREFMANRTEIKIREEFEPDKYIFTGLSMYLKSIEDDEET